MSDRKGRPGVNYVCSVVAQAALPNPEFKSGEDHLAVDLNVEFPTSPVRVQVKCGTRKANKSGSLYVPLHAKWRGSMEPVQDPRLPRVRLFGANVAGRLDRSWR